MVIHNIIHYIIIIMQLLFSVLSGTLIFQDHFKKLQAIARRNF